MKVMTDAGVEFVPFDSQALNDVSADAWGAGTESYAYEDTDTLARSRSCSPTHSSPLPPQGTPPIHLPHTHPSSCTPTYLVTHFPAHPPTHPLTIYLSS